MRIDKYDPKDGGFRAALRIDMDATPGGVGDDDAGIGVSLDNAGRVVPCGHANDNSGFVGLLVLTRNHKAGDIVDVMTDGEIVEFGGTAGTVYTVDITDGSIVAIEDPPETGFVRIGHTAEADRLIVRVDRAADTVVDTNT